MVTGQSLYFCFGAADGDGDGVGPAAAGTAVGGAAVAAEESRVARGLELEYYPERLLRRSWRASPPSAPQPRHSKCCASRFATETGL